MFRGDMGVRMGETGVPGVSVRREGGVVTLVIDRAAKRNALTFAMYRALGSALRAADADPQVRAVVLTGTDGSFTAGNDLGDFLSGEDVATGEDPAVLAFQRAVLERHKVLVAAVDGAAVGIGATVLLHCDLVYATERSYLRFPFVDLGLVPEFASSLLLPRFVGPRRAAEILLFGEQVPAVDAAELGLVNEVLADHDALVERVAERTAALSAKPAAALDATWELLHGNATDAPRKRMSAESVRFAELLSSTETVSRLEGFLRRNR